MYYFFLFNKKKKIYLNANKLKEYNRSYNSRCNKSWVIYEHIQTIYEYINFFLFNNNNNILDII